MSFFTKFEKKLDNGLMEDLYPKILRQERKGILAPIGMVVQIT